jgi:hypothetical protein
MRRRLPEPRIRSPSCGKDPEERKGFGPVKKSLPGQTSGRKRSAERKTVRIHRPPTGRLQTSEDSGAGPDPSTNARLVGLDSTTLCPHMSQSWQDGYGDLHIGSLS